MTYIHTYIHSVVHQFRVCITAVFVILHTYYCIPTVINWSMSRILATKKLHDVHQQWNPACGNTGSSCVCGNHQQHHQWWTCIAHIYTAIRTMPASMKKPPVGGALSSSMHDAWAINSLNENNLNRLYPANNLSKTQNMFWEQQCLMIQNSFWIQHDLLPNIFVAKQLFVF